VNKRSGSVRGEKLRKKRNMLRKMEGGIRKQTCFTGGLLYKIEKKVGERKSCQRLNVPTVEKRPTDRTPSQKGRLKEKAPIRRGIGKFMNAIEGRGTRGKSNINPSD